MNPTPPPSPRPPRDGRFRRLLARFGVAGFLFFLIKGLLWLVAPAALVALGVGC